MLILFGLIISGQMRFRKTDGWDKIVKVYHSRSKDQERCAS
jgi:hypothetical protein